MLIELLFTTSIFSLCASSTVLQHLAREALTGNPPAGSESQQLDVAQILCDAPRYGQNVRPASCKKAILQVMEDTRQLTFSDRSSTVPNDIPLPYRVQSKDGLCYLEVVLVDGAASGHSSSTQFGAAAWITIKQCVAKYGFGGIASNFGGDNKLEVIISSYKPNVKCSHDTGPPWGSTVAIFAGMPTTTTTLEVGRAGTGVDLPLPYFLKADDGRAVVKIDSDGRRSITSWYEIWESVNAVAYMCVTPSPELAKGGKATKIGALSNIFIELFDRDPELADLQNVTSIEGLLPQSPAMNFSLGDIALYNQTSGVNIS